MARFLCVGVATLDIINRVERYPEEDSEIRAFGQARRVGGNATNTATVLSQLGDSVAWAGNLGDRPEVDLIRQHFSEYGVDYSAAHQIPGGGVPTSCITLSEVTGSRTIVHFRDLPEYPAEQFVGLDLRPYDWIHFEGRAVPELSVMMVYARKQTGASISLEVEKPRADIEALFGQADLLLFSADYLQARGERDPAAFLRGLPTACMATCTEGARGAWGRDAEGRLFHESAWQPRRVVDTLGAGDVFNAGILHGIARGWSLKKVLAFAVRLAGEKCGREGVPIA